MPKASGVYNAFVKPYGECKDDTTADGYKALDFNIATGEGYISGFGYDEDHPDLFLCAEHNGASNLPVGDYYWNNNDGFRVAILGGRWNDGANRLNEHDEILKSNSEMIGAIKELATEVKYMRGDLNETVERLNKLEGKDGDKWDKFKWLIVTGLVTLILGYLAVSVGLK